MRRNCMSDTDQSKHRGRPGYATSTSPLMHDRSDPPSGSPAARSPPARSGCNSRHRSHTQRTEPAWGSNRKGSGEQTPEETSIQRLATGQLRLRWAPNERGERFDELAFTVDGSQVLAKLPGERGRRLPMDSLAAVVAPRRAARRDARGGRTQPDVRRGKGLPGRRRRGERSRIARRRPRRQPGLEAEVEGGNQLPGHPQPACWRARASARYSIA